MMDVLDPSADQAESEPAMRIGPLADALALARSCVGELEATQLGQLIVGSPDWPRAEVREHAPKGAFSGRADAAPKDLIARAGPGVLPKALALELADATLP